MNAKLLGLFSGFPTHHFPSDIAERLKEEILIRDSLVFISAWPADYDRNDSDSAGMNEMFAEIGMPFYRYHVIDKRMECSDAKALIRDASCIFLMGGHATDQFKLICEKELIEEIHESNAVILGVSAGSINMAKRALDIWESHVPYVGLGLTNITIKAHVCRKDQELLQTLMQISIDHDLTIFAMQDESAIFIKNDSITFTGEICCIKKDEIRSLTSEILELYK